MTPLTRRATRRALTVVGLAVALFTVTAPADAAPPVAQGWWWAAQSEGLNLPSQVGSLVPEQAGPQGVPENGLYVAGSAASEEAVAVLRFFVPEGDTAQTLELTLAGEPTGTPVIQLCTVTSSWTPEQQGAWSKRPEFDCADDAPVGTVSEDGTTVTFDLTGLTLAGQVDFGLAPGVDAAGGTAAFQAPIEKPGLDALQVASDDEGPGGPVLPSSTAAPSGSQSEAESSPARPAALPQAPAASGGVNLAPVATRSSAPAPSAVSDFAAAPAAAPTPIAAVPVSSSNDLRTVGMIGLLALAAFYAWLTGQESREPTSLLTFGRTSSGPVIDAEALK